MLNMEMVTACLENYTEQQQQHKINAFCGQNTQERLSTYNLQ